MSYMPKMFLLFLLFSSFLFAKEKSIELSNLLGSSREIVRTIFSTSKESNDIVDAYFHSLIFAYNKKNIIDGIVLTQAHHQKEQIQFALMHLIIGDKIEKIKKLYGNNYMFFRSWSEGYTGIWKVNDKMLIVGFNKKAKEYYITSITYCMQDSFVAKF